jgi:hypothetical protein
LEPANPIKLILTSLHQSKKRRNGKKAPLALEKEAPTNREKEPVAMVKTYLVKTGETPLLLCGLWFSRWLLKWTTLVVDYGKIKKIRGDWRGLLWRWTVVDCWLRERD